MKPSDKIKLQRLINRTSKAASDFYRANTKLCEFCVEHYGFEPGDVDADAIIDAVQGGAGDCAGMSADEFDRIMREAGA